MSKAEAFIIGSGVAGLAAAIRLRVAGHPVTVFEKNEAPGGKIGLLEQDGFRFDTGPSLFTEPQLLEELFQLAGVDMAPYFSYQPVPLACRYFYEEGAIINAYTDRQAFAAELKEKLGEEPEALHRYLNRSAKVYDTIGKIFTETPIHRTLSLLRSGLGPAIGANNWGDWWHTLHEYNRKSFKHPHTVQLFDRFATYNGSHPWRAPALLHQVAHLEHNLGVYYPQGGMISISRALHQLAADLGVVFEFNAVVERIISHEGRVRGLVVNGSNLSAGLVVSNSDAATTHDRLLRNPHQLRRLLRKPRSSSAMVFYWGMGAAFPQLDLHNIFFSKNYKEEFRSLFKQKTIAADPTVYVNISAKMEAGHAPEGKENWFVMVNAPADAGQDWQQLRQNTRAAIIQKLNRLLDTDVEARIETEGYWDPPGISHRTSSCMGAIYGAASNSRMAAFWRPANFSSAVKGLYFCGGSVHPGGGIPLCLKSAGIVAQLVNQNSNQPKKKH